MQVYRQMVQFTLLPKSMLMETYLIKVEPMLQRSITLLDFGPEDLMAVAQ